MSVAIADAGQNGRQALAELDRISEHPGCGLEARSGNEIYRLGRPDWALGGEAAISENGVFSVSLLVRDGAPLARFVFEDSIRPDARETVARLQRHGLAVEILSGDRKPAVEALASHLADRKGQLGTGFPPEKVARITELSEAGSKVLMVGDGLNDAPALAAAHVSMAPATAADIGRNAADFVFLHESLSAVPDALEICAQCGHPDPPEFRAGDRLQRHRGTDRGLRLRDPTRRGGRHVAFFSPRRGKRDASGQSRSTGLPTATRTSSFSPKRDVRAGS